MFDEEDWRRRVQFAKDGDELRKLLQELPSLDYESLGISHEDRLYLLKFCVHPGKLVDPARWCNEHRALHTAIKAGPKSVSEVEALMEISERLATEARG